MKTTKYKKLGIEVTETLHYGKSFKECMKLKPKGWRLLKPSEALAIWEIEPFIDWFFVEQPIKKLKGEYVARFYAEEDGADLGCYGNPDGSSGALGVKWCRKLKKEKTK